jgi:hypothetical protein
MTKMITTQIPSRWRCIECQHEYALAATTPARQEEWPHHPVLSPPPAEVCTECGAADQFEQIRGLTPVAIATLAMAGITPQQWIEASSYGYVPPAGQELTWTGDVCGCTDSRCANGFHHMGLTDCGCLPVLIEQYQSTGEI